MVEEGISVHRTCKIGCMSRSMYYYSHAKDDEEVVAKLMDLAGTYPNRGFETYYGKIRMADRLQ